MSCFANLNGDAWSTPSHLPVQLRVVEGETTTVSIARYKWAPFKQTRLVKGSIRALKNSLFTSSSSLPSGSMKKLLQAEVSAPRPSSSSSKDWLPEIEIRICSNKGPGVQYHNKASATYSGQFFPTELGSFQVDDILT